ncbi:MAG: galactokinase [Pseudomonadota bacterium]
MTDSLQALLLRSCEEFSAWANCPLEFLALAPGRVNLMGDHTDYAGGLCLPMAVDLHTVLCAGRDGLPGVLTVISSQGDEVQIPLDDFAPNGDWADYLRGVLAGYKLRGASLPSLRIRVSGDLPLGSGLSSSASLELAMAMLIEQVCEFSIDAHERVLLCQRAESTHAGVPCGILDQHAVTFGIQSQAMILDCATERSVTVALPAGIAVAVIDSGVRHALADGSYAQRREQVTAATDIVGKPLVTSTFEELSVIDDPLLARRARHVLSESARVVALAEAFADSDLAGIAEIMRASHRSLSKDFEVSCPEVDQLVALAMELGAIGARMTGGGFGGSVVALVEREKRQVFESDLSEKLPTINAGAKLRWVSSAEGARALNPAGVTCASVAP